jgi:hypothetical protein
LDHPGLIVFDVPAAKAINKQVSKLEVDIEGYLTGGHLEAIFENDKLCASREKKWKESRELNESREKLFVSLKDIGNLTVGKLVNKRRRNISGTEVFANTSLREEDITK